MQPNQLNNLLQNIDIYLLDQILKGRIALDNKILDAGCGNGRNSKYFLNQNYNLIGIDLDTNKINSLKAEFGNDKFYVSSIEKTNFSDNEFDYIICNAVLHFSQNKKHFFKMFAELYRILNKNGTLFIRMTSNIGIEKKVQELENGVYKIPDGSTRFLLTKELVQQLQNQFSFSFVEPLKTVNVNDLRCMTTLIIKKD